MGVNEVFHFCDRWWR